MTLNAGTNGAGQRPAAPQVAAPEIYKKVVGDLDLALLSSINRALRELQAQDIYAPRVESFYYQLLLEIERRRQALGVSQERLSEMAGLPDRAYAKMLYPETKTGRLARWSTIQIVCDALYPDGFDVKIIPRKGDKLTAMSIKYQIKQLSANYNRKSQRELMKELSEKAAKARAEKIPEGRRIKIARKAAKARWRKPKVTEIAGWADGCPVEAALTRSPRRRRLAK